MAEKRVSVRLVAEGGRQVRAELEGIGDAGARGFGRLSTEMELANTRLASFARKAGIALAAVTVAAAAAGVAMVRSGLETIGAQADMAASLKTTVESLQVLTWAGELAGVSMGEIEQATKKLTTRLSEAAAGSGSAVGALQRLNLTAAELQALPLDQRIVAIQEALNRFVPEAERAAVASDLFGDKAALAFLRIDPAALREAAQDVRDFGVAVSATDAAQIERTGDAIAKLSLIWLGLTNRLTAAVAPALETIANTLSDMARSTGPIGIAINALFDNIGRLTTYAATFATLMAGRWVAGLAAAALSVRGLATGLVILRGALIRTGIGALIVGAGELVFQFTRLVAGAGGFGAAIGLLKDLALEVWDRIGLGAASAWSKIEASWAGLQATIYGAMQSSVEAVTSFANSAAGIFKGAYDAVKAIWGQLPGAIGDFAFQAANGLIGGVEAMLNGVVTRINNFINGLNAALDLLPDWAVGEGGVRIGTLDPVALGRIDNPFAGSAAAAGTAAAEAFSAAMAQTYVTTPDLGLTGMAEEATARAEAYREASGMLADAAARPMQSWQALKDAVSGAGTEGETALDGATEAADRLDESMTEAGRAAGGAGAAAAAGAEVAKTGWEAAVATLADYAAKARDIGGDVGNALVSAFTSAENAVGEFVKTGKLDFRDLVTSMIADLAKLAARRFILGPIANALSGALGGAGGIFADILHSGGTVGLAGSGRMVPALAFANAPRMHSGGWAGIKPDEVPAILQRGERVLSRRETAGYGQGQSSAPAVNVTINARDAESFRQSRTQVAADIARAVSLGPEGHMMAFHEIRFPDNISRGARGGPERRTQIVELASGDEERNASWANSRRRYDVAYGIRRADDLAAVVAFFEARNGRLHGFRYKDWADYKSALPSQAITATDQQIGTGTGSQQIFQLTKRYTSGAQTWMRTITKPVAGTVRVALGMVEQMSGWTVDTTTGVVTFTTAPTGGVAVRAGFEFDVPVRFDSDTLDVTLDFERLGSITAIPLLEIRR